MNRIHLFLLVLVVVFVLLRLLSRKWAMSYARITVLALAGSVMLMPFVWLICAAFKDKDVMNAYVFLPPPAQISN